MSIQHLEPRLDKKERHHERCLGPCQSVMRDTTKGARIGAGDKSLSQRTDQRRPCACWLLSVHDTGANLSRGADWVLE